MYSKLKSKSETYKRKLEHGSRRYEQRKGISIVVDSIKTATKRSTKLQIQRYNDYLVNKYFNMYYIIYSIYENMIHMN